MEGSSERTNTFGTDVGDAEHPQHCPWPSDRDISAKKKKGFKIEIQSLQLSVSKRTTGTIFLLPSYKRRKN